MKKILFIGLTVSMFLAGFTACSDWTEPEALVYVTADGLSDEYYANLRQWKSQTKHDMAFGWYGFWSGTGASLNNCLIGLPDSIHLVSIWGGWLPSSINDSKKKDLEYVQNVKGTVVTNTVITGWVGVGILTDMYDYETKENLYGWKQEWNTVDTWNSSDPAERALQEEAIRKYSRAIADSCILAGYEGFDIDWEPTVGGAGCKQELSNEDNFFIHVDEMGKYFGPKSGTGRLLIIDGELGNIPPSVTPYFDYFIAQNYNTITESALNSSVSTLIRICDGVFTPEEAAAKYFCTVNFESNSQTGGVSSMTEKNQLQMFAEWQPTYGGERYRKGGFGAYHIEMEYVAGGKDGFYPWTRAGIQAVHPSGEKSLADQLDDEEENEGTE